MFTGPRRRNDGPGTFIEYPCLTSLSVLCVRGDVFTNQEVLRPFRAS